MFTSLLKRPPYREFAITVQYEDDNRSLRMNKMKMMNKKEGCFRITNGTAYLLSHSSLWQRTQYKELLALGVVVGTPNLAVVKQLTLELVGSICP
jgi:hypothetical protein